MGQGRLREFNRVYVSMEKIDNLLEFSHITSYGHVISIVLLSSFQF
jgi:hypothetical protein